MEKLVTGKNILIIEDETLFAKAVQRQLTRAGYNCEIVKNLTSAKKQLATSPVTDLILLDMRLPDGSGLDFLKTIKNSDDAADIPIIVMSAYGEIEDAVSAMKIGASDYLKKPVDLQELLLHVENVLAKNELEAKLAYSNKRESNATESVQFIGECSQILSIKQQVEQIAHLTYTSDSVPPSVMILGETGTGKDIAARFLHVSTVLRDRPFVQIDCASLPRDIIEAELFGHEKGAFTNAYSARMGLIEAAENGILFIDEIGELPLELQTKLLAVLERRLIRRVGASKELPISAWFIAATNRKLDQLVNKGDFRADLYYRLNVLSIEMPPLRQRGKDIMLLAHHFAQHVAQRYGLGQPIFSDQAKKEIAAYQWPGNVREMKHLVERAVLLSNGGVLTTESFNLHDDYKVSDQRAPTVTTLESTEQVLIKQALKQVNGNVSKAAKELGITRMAMRYRMKKYNIL